MLSKLGLKRGKLKASQMSGGRPNYRGRRMGFGAFHFRQEKICKQLLAAVTDGDVDTVKKLIDSGLEVEQIDDGVPALRLACDRGELEIVSLLLNLGAHVNSCGEASSAPLHLAAHRGHVDIVALLLSHGANVNLPNKSELRSALHVAALANNESCVRILIANEAKVNMRDIYGSVPLHLAALKGHKDVVRLLLENGAPVDDYDNDGWTSLHLAAEAGDVTTAKVLLASHCQVDCQNKYGRTPLHWACSAGRIDVVRLLLKHNANVNIKDFHDKNAMSYACDSDIQRILKPLTLSDGQTSKLVSSSTIGLHVHINPRASFKRRTGEGDVDNDNDSDVDEDSLPSTIYSSGDVTSLKSGSVDGGNTNANNAVAMASDDDNMAAVLLSSRSPSQTFTSQLSVSTDSHEDTSVVDDVECHVTFQLPDPAKSPHRSPALSKSSRQSSQSGDTEVNFYTQISNESADFMHDSNIEVTNARNLLIQTFAKILESLSTIKKNVRTAARDLNRSCDSENHVVMSETLKTTQVSFQSILRVISDLSHECHSTVQTTQKAMDELLKQFATRFDERQTLPVGYCQAFLLACSLLISHEKDGWCKVVRCFKKDEQATKLISKISSVCVSELERAMETVTLVVVHLSDDCHTVIRDVTKFLAKCGLVHYDKKAVIRKMLCLSRPNIKLNLAIRGSVLYTLISRLSTDDALNTCSWLGVIKNNEENTEMSSEKCLQLLNSWNVNSSVTDHVTELALCMVDIGREDLLEVLLWEQPSSGLPSCE